MNLSTSEKPRTEPLGIDAPLPDRSELRIVTPEPPETPPENSRGRFHRIPVSRNMVRDLVYFADKEPSFPTIRHFDLAPLVEARNTAPVRIGWTALFLRAYGLVSQEHEWLRQTYMPFPLAHLYEHPHSIGRVAVTRRYRNEDWVFFAPVPHPEWSTLREIQAVIDRHTSAPVDDLIFGLQAKVARLPGPLRRLAWRVVLYGYGPLRMLRVGTFGVTTLGRLGAASGHSPRLQSTVLSYGPIDEAGQVRVTAVYDHRIMDGLHIASSLKRLEETMNETLVDELRSLRFTPAVS